MKNRISSLVLLLAIVAGFTFLAHRNVKAKPHAPEVKNVAPESTKECAKPCPLCPKDCPKNCPCNVKCPTETVKPSRWQAGVNEHSDGSISFLDANGVRTSITANTIAQHGCEVIRAVIAKQQSSCQTGACASAYTPTFYAQPVFAGGCAGGLCGSYQGPAPAASFGGFSGGSCSGGSCSSCR